MRNFWLLIKYIILSFLVGWAANELTKEIEMGIVTGLFTFIFCVITQIRHER